MASDHGIQIIELIEQPTLVVRREVAPPQLGAALAGIFPRVFARIAAAGGALAGAPFMRYLDMNPGSFTIAAGIPVAGWLPGEGDIEPHTLPGGKAVTALHLGDYAAVGVVWEAVWGFAQRHGATTRWGGWDAYTNDPTEVAPEAVETRVYLPLQLR